MKIKPTTQHSNEVHLAITVWPAICFFEILIKNRQTSTTQLEDVCVSILTTVAFYLRNKIKLKTDLVTHFFFRQSRETLRNTSFLELGKKNEKIQMFTETCSQN